MSTLATPFLRTTTFWQDTVLYARQMNQFTRADWKKYVAWVGLMLGLLFSVSFFTLFGLFNHVVFPAYVWNLPVGTFIFVVAIAFDTIGHLTTYKEDLKNGEDLVHQITIFAGITSCLLLCLGYTFPVAMNIPALSMIILSIFFSVVDEGLHWHRYLHGRSDRVEMWSHFFIFLGHTIMISSWYYWFYQGYQGVPETLAALRAHGLVY